MSARILKWGLLSTARINQALIPPLRASKRNQLVGVASRSPEQAQVYAAEWDIPRSYGSYESMLADPEIEVIYNPLPNSLHVEWTVKALQAGKHVLCEKPLAISLEGVDEIRSAAEKTGLVVSEAFMYRHHPLTLKVKDLVDKGALGRVWLVKGAFTFSLERLVDVRLDPELGGGSIWDIGCYPISYARYILGSEPEEVFGWQYTGPSGVDETFTGQMLFSGDRFVQFDCGFRAPYRTLIEVVGSEGSLRLTSPFKPGLKDQIVIDRGGDIQVIKVRGQELYIGEVEDMAAAILDGKEPRVSLEDSRGNVATIVGLLRSAEESKPVQSLAFG